MAQTAKIMNPFKSPEFSIVRQNSIDLILDSLHSKAGCILEIMKICEFGHEICPMLKNQAKSIYKNSLATFMYQAKSGQSNDRKVDADKAINFLLEKIIGSEILEGNKNAVELLLYIVYYFDHGVKKKAMDILLATGLDEGQKVVLEVLDNVFLLDRLPELVRILFQVDGHEPGIDQASLSKSIDMANTSDKILDTQRGNVLRLITSHPKNKNKGIDTAASWLVIGNEKRMIEAIKLYHDYEVGDENRAYLLRNIKHLKKVLSGENNYMYDIDVRIMVYEIASWLFYSDDKHQEFVLKIFSEFAKMEKSVRGANRLIKFYNDFPCTKAEDLAEFILRICKSKQVYGGIKKETEEALVGLSENDRIAFYQKILAASVDRKTAWETVMMLYKLDNSASIIKFFAKSRISSAGLEYSAQFFFRLREREYFRNEFDKKISDKDLDNVIEAIWKRIEKTKSKKNLLSQVVQAVSNASKKYVEKCISLLLLTAGENKLFDNSVYQLLIIRLTHPSLKRKVDKALLALKDKHIQELEKLLLDCMTNGVSIGMERVYRSSAEFLGDQNCAWSRRLLKSIIDKEMNREYIECCVEALSTKAINGDDEALSIITKSDRISHFWTIPDNLIRVYNNCSKKLIKSMLIQASLSRTERAILINTDSCNAMSMSKEFSLVEACFNDYKDEDKKRLLRVIAKMPQAKKINGAMDVVLKKIIVLFEKSHKNDLIQLFQKMVSDCRTFDFEGFTDYQKEVKEKELTYFLGIMDTFLLDLY